MNVGCFYHKMTVDQYPINVNGLSIIFRNHILSLRFNVKSQIFVWRYIWYKMFMKCYVYRFCDIDGDDYLCYYMFIIMVKNLIKVLDNALVIWLKNK